MEGVEQLALPLDEEVEVVAPNHRNLIRDLTVSTSLSIRVFEIANSKPGPDEWSKQAYELFGDLREYDGGYTILSVREEHAVTWIRVLAWVHKEREGMFPVPNLA